MRISQGVPVEKSGQRVIWGSAGVLLLLTAAVALLIRGETGREWRVSGPSDAPEFIFYTSASVTTPQLPFWVALSDSNTPPARWRVRAWKNLDDLQTAVLAGKGDFWLGHIEGFARARRAGAPVIVLAVTGWRKFFLVARPEAAARNKLAEWRGHDLPYAPPGTPGVLIAQALLGKDAEQVRFSPHEPRQLAALLARDIVQGALLPEPLVSLLCKEVPDLAVVGSLEDEYGAWSGYPSRLPLAGLAVHQDVLTRYPEFVTDILNAWKKAATRAAADPKKALATLPSEFMSWLSEDVAHASLDRDVIHLERAISVREEIESYLRLVAPETLEAGMLDKLLGP